MKPDALPNWMQDAANRPRESRALDRGAPLVSSDETISQHFLTIPDVAHLLHVSTRTVRRMVADGRLAAIHIGRTVRVRPEEIDKLR